MDTSAFTERELINRLRAHRDDYLQERDLHSLWIDSYTGMGGFCHDRVPILSAPYWGHDAYEYGDWAAYYGDYGLQQKSYLIRHRNEDTRDYNERVRASVYENPIKPIVDITNAFLTSEDAVRDLPPQILDWSNNVNGHGMHIRALVKDALKRAQVVGRVFAMVIPPADPGQTMAETVVNGAWPTVRLLWPQDVLDYDVDRSGKLVGIKYRTVEEVKRKNMLQPKQFVERITIWTPTEWMYWDIVRGNPTYQQPGMSAKDEIVDHQSQEHDLGIIPLALLRWSVPIDDNRTVAGLCQIDNIAGLARTLYNRASELDDHLRKSNFAQLVIPGTQDAVDSGKISVGPSNALVEDENTNGISRYISPSLHIAEAYERRIDKLLDAIYRNALIDRGERRVAEKAESIRARFVQTNNVLAEVAERLDAWEMDIYQLVARIMRMGDALEQGMVRRRRDYQMGILTEQIKIALDSLDLPFGQKGMSSLMKKAYRGLNSDLPSKEYEEIDLEIEEAVKAKIQAQAVSMSQKTPDDVQTTSMPSAPPHAQTAVPTWRTDIPGSPNAGAGA